MLSRIVAIIFIILFSIIFVDAVIKTDIIDEICGIPTNTVGLISGGNRVDRGSLPW